MTSYEMVFAKYAQLTLPRHTSYPTVNHWQSDFSESNFLDALSQIGRGGSGEISVYVHVPFCRQLCFYCGCSKEILGPRNATLADEKARAFVEALLLEMEHKLARMPEQRSIRQLHFGGGTPSYLSLEELGAIIDKLKSHLIWHKNIEASIELDPRTVEPAYLRGLKDLGFNRLSLGVQDFDPQVQSVINRRQSLESVQSLTEAARTMGFESVNYDLIYGLPFQTQDSFRATLEKTAQLAPDRIALYRLAVLPEMFKWQKSFLKADLPDSLNCAQMFLDALAFLQDQDYAFIGLDHFAKKYDPLAKAAVHGGLRRNFQGMSTGRLLDILAFGPSAISDIQNTYAQNEKSFKNWLQAVRRGHFAMSRGHVMSTDDRIRAEVLQSLYCNGMVDFAKVRQEFGLSSDYFKDVLTRLKPLQDDGIISTLTPQRLALSMPLGRFLARIPAAFFDAYLPEFTLDQGQKNTSQVI